MTSCGRRLLITQLRCRRLSIGGLNLDAGNTRNDVIDRAQLMQSNLETISKLERKYREYTDELRRRYPAPGVNSRHGS
jgi:hypothetical protein